MLLFTGLILMKKLYTSNLKRINQFIFTKQIEDRIAVVCSFIIDQFNASCVFFFKKTPYHTKISKKLNTLVPAMLLALTISISYTKYN